MALEQKKIVLLIREYLDGSITVDDKLVLEDWLAQDEANAKLLEEMQDESWLWEQLVNYNSLAAEDIDRVALKMAMEISATYGNKTSSRLMPTWTRYVAAAIVLFVFSISYYVYFYSSNSQVSTEDSQVLLAESLPEPGGNRATLTLDNGELITLSEKHSGLISGETMAYEDGSTITSTKTTFATLNTPRGGQYNVTLPDGTKVMLNASSSLRYPTQFNEKERKVVLTGEAYFEVTQQLERPFIVETATQHLQVLGTVFNINAYSDELKTTTTLIEGKVAIDRLSSVAEPTILLPGQQSMLDAHDIKVVAVDAREAVAWKEGKFVFENSDIYTVMRQIARWYDVEVQYEGDVSAVSFSGTLSRSAPITGILEDLELTKSIKVNIEGRRIIIGKR